MPFLRYITGVPGKDSSGDEHSEVPEQGNQRCWLTNFPIISALPEMR